MPVLQRQGIHNGNAYTLDISPANITLEKSNNKNEKQAFYKTVVAEIVEYALHKLAVSDGLFFGE